MVLRLAEEPPGPQTWRFGPPVSATQEDVLRSEPVCARRSGPGRQKSGSHVHVGGRASMKACNVHSPERGAGPAAQTPLWTRSAFITARLCGSSPSLVPYLFFKSPKETLARWAGVSQRSRPGAENRGASSHHRKLKPVGGGRSGFSAALA